MRLEKWNEPHFNASKMLFREWDRIYWAPESHPRVRQYYDQTCVFKNNTFGNRKESKLMNLETEVCVCVCYYKKFFWGNVVLDLINVRGWGLCCYYWFSCTNFCSFKDPNNNLRAESCKNTWNGEKWWGQQAF